MWLDLPGQESVQIVKTKSVLKLMFGNVHAKLESFVLE